MMTFQIIQSPEIDVYGEYVLKGIDNTYAVSTCGNLDSVLEYFSWWVEEINNSLPTNEVI